MITFEVYRQLDIRLFQTVAVVDSTYGACAKYILDGDSLILLGSDHSIRLNVSDKTVSNDVPIRNWDIESEAVLWFSEESTEAILIKMIANAFKQYLGVEPFGSQEEFSGTIEAVNSRLEQYSLKIIADDNGMCIFYEDREYSFEEAILLIMDMDENRMDTGEIINLINEALFYRKVDKMEEAAACLEKVVRYVDHTQPVHTDVLFLLAETYYFLGNYERAVSLYYRCHMEFIENEDNFYTHLGHALLDEKMKKYERQVKIYYRAKIDAEYADTHRQAVAASATEVGDVFEEYEKTCNEMGRKKYAEYRNNLPVGADDIDELLVFEKDKRPVSADAVKRYKDFTLMMPNRSELSGKRSVPEMLSTALSLFLDGEYQKSYEIYVRLSEEVTAQSDYGTWVFYMLGKLYCFFGEPKKAYDELKKCDPNRFGNVYRQDDFLILLDHVRILCEDFESDTRFRDLIRGKLDNYFAQYDREYNLLLKDRKLMKNYRAYETECYNNAVDEFGDDIDIREEVQEVRGGLLDGIKHLFRR